MLVKRWPGSPPPAAQERDLMRTYAAGYGHSLVKLGCRRLALHLQSAEDQFDARLDWRDCCRVLRAPIVGMGFRISTEVGRMNIDMVWAEIAVAALAGSAVLRAGPVVERKLTFWHPSIDHDGWPKRGQGNEEADCKAWADAGASCSAGSAPGAGQGVLQLKWVTQGQFAGYYVAKEKGFYEEAGLDVEIKPGGPDIAPAAGDRRRRRRRDRRLDALRARLAREGRAARQHRPAFHQVGHDADLPQGDRHHQAGGLQGKTLGVWFFGNEYPFLSWMSKLGISTEGGPKA
jgi:hypothetical protein